MSKTEKQFKPFNVIKQSKKKFFYKFIDKWLMKYRPYNTFLIEMEHDNGYHEHFIAKIREDHFKHRGKTYVIDESIKYWSQSCKKWCLSYHESFSLPIRKEWDVKKIKDMIEMSPYKAVFQSTNPKVLQTFIKSEVAKQVMRGAVDESLRKIIILLVIVVIASVAHLLLFMQESGMLKGITGGQVG